MTPTELTLDTPHLRLAARAWGPEDGLPVLALHGWLDNAASFDRLAPLLSGCRVVALDLPGHGRSQHLPAGCSYHFVDSVPRVLEAADALGWQHFVLLGHSMGAGVSTLVPGVVPERVLRLVLIEGMGPLTDDPDRAVAQLAKALAHEGRHAKSRRGRLFPSLEAAVAARAASGDLAEEHAEILVRRGTEAVDGGVCFTHDRRLQLPSRLRFTPHQVQSFLGAIACPVLAIRAEPGWPFPAEMLLERRSWVRNLQFETVSGGHHVHLSEPEKVAPVIRAFLTAEGRRKS